LDYSLLYYLWKLSPTSNWSTLTFWINGFVSVLSFSGRIRARAVAVVIVAAAAAATATATATTQQQQLLQLIDVSAAHDVVARVSI